MRFKDAGVADVDTVERVLPPTISREELAKVIGYRTNAGTPGSVVPNFIGERLFDTTGADFYMAFGVAAGEWIPLGLNTLSAAELAFLDGALATNLVAAKAAILGTAGALTLGGSLTAVGSLIIGAADLNEADLEKLDGITDGTVAANKAIVPTTDKHIDALVISDGGLALGAGAGTVINATALELNRAADVSTRIVNATAATLAVTEAAHDGRTIVLDLAAGIAVTLPAAAAGLRFRFVVKTTFTGAASIKSVSGADIMIGHALMGNDTNDTVVDFQSLAVTTNDTIDLFGTANSTGGIAGQIVEIEGLATNLWFVEIRGDAAGTEATPFANTVA